MDELKIPAAFERVWERVTAIDDCSTVPETQRQELERFIEAKQCAINLYSAISARSGVKERQIFCQVMAEERRHLKNLQIEYFMLVGDVCMPKPSCVLEHMGLLSMLRGACLDEVSVAQRFMQASDRRGGELGELYEGIAEDDKRHAQMLKEIICRAL